MERTCFIKNIHKNAVYYYSKTYQSSVQINRVHQNKKVINTIFKSDFLN